MEKVEHLLKLADEYQVMSIFDLCVKCLKDEPKSKKNAVRILYLASTSVIARDSERLDVVRQECYSLIEDMQLNDIMEKEDFKSLDRDSSERALVKRTERLEKFIEEIYPQMIGLVEFCIVLCMEDSKRRPSLSTCCPNHFVVASHLGRLHARIQACQVCKKMVEELVSLSKECKHRNYVRHRYGGSKRFDEKLISVIQDFENVLHPSLL